MVVVSCATKKPEKRSKLLKGFYTQYNTLFNGEEALNTEFQDRSKAYKDNFYAPYIPILTYEDQPLGSDLGQTPAFAENSQKMSTLKDSTPRDSGKKSRENNITPPVTIPGRGPGAGPEAEAQKTTALQVAEAKAKKAIEKYSVIRQGEEKNKKIFDAYILLAQSRIYQNKNVEALDALNQIFMKMEDDKRIPLAKIYQGLAYAKLKDYKKANDYFQKLKTEKLNKEQEQLLSIYYSETLLDAGKKEEAIKELDNAFAVNTNRKLKSRIAYLRGQILQEQGKNELARNSFMDAYKYANDFEFEVKSQIEIAKTHNGKSDYAGAKKYLEDIAKKGTYGSRKNEFYYALGLMANKAEKGDEAQNYFRKSLKEKQSDSQIRGLTYYEIGKGYLDKNDYIGAGAYYDSALVAMTYEPSKVLLKNQSEYIKKISKNYYLIKKNDSILALTKMSEEQKTDYFSKFIAQLKAKEEKIEAEKRREEREKGFDSGDFSTSSIFSSSNNAFEDFGVSTKGFYFGNTGTVSKGVNTFKQTWGQRGLSDNWRYSQKMTSIEDVKNEALGIASVPNPRRYETAFYIEKIPKDAALLGQLKKDRDTASLGLGVMYENYFTNTPLATKTLYDLVDNKPEEKLLQQALYEIFAMNYQKNPSAAERAKQILINDYPYTSYAEFARNPKGTTFVKSSQEVENKYLQAFALYEAGKFAESTGLLDQMIQQYPQDALTPKLYLLNAFNAGKSNGKEVMILQLEQISLNYGKTPEGEKAKEMLNYLKSEINFQATDEKGNVVGSGNANKTVAPPSNIPAEANKLTPPGSGPGSPSFGPGTPTMEPAKEVKKPKK